MCTRPQYTALTYMGGTGPYGPLTVIFCFDLYGRYRTLWTDDDNFLLCSLELVNKPKYQIWCESDVPCAHSPSLPIGLIWEVPDPVDR